MSAPPPSGFALPSRLRGVRYVSLADDSGYGEAGRRLVDALRRRGVPVTWTPMVPGSAWGLSYEPFEGRAVGNPELDACCNLDIPHDVVVVHTVPEYYPHWRRRIAGRTFVGHTVWETDRIPRHWGPLLAVPDRLWVPSAWTRDAFRRSGVETPIDVVPHLPLAELGDGEPPWDLGDAECVFLTVGEWTVRKAIDLTIRSYLEAFRSSDPTLLVVKTSTRDRTIRFLPRFRGRSEQSLRRIARRVRDPARILLIDEPVPRDDLLRLIARCDCYISLARSEGWGLPAFDAATHGTPVIATGFGGWLDYLPRDAAHLVEHAGVSVDDPAARASYSPDQRWAEPRVEHGARLLRQVFEHPGEAEKRGRMLAEHVARELSEERTLARVARSLTEATA